MAFGDDREAILKKDGYLIGIATFGLVNGQSFSPWFDPVSVLLRPILFGFSITSPILIFYLSSLLVSVGTVLLAGIPAAVFENSTGRKESDATSMGVWMAACALLTLPAFLSLFRGG